MSEIIDAITIPVGLIGAYLWVRLTVQAIKGRFQ